MDAGALGGGQIIDAPPTHLQEHERNEQEPQGETRPVITVITFSRCMSASPNVAVVMARNNPKWENIEH